VAGSAKGDGGAGTTRHAFAARWRLGSVDSRSPPTVGGNGSRHPRPPRHCPPHGRARVSRGGDHHITHRESARRQPRVLL